MFMYFNHNDFGQLLGYNQVL